MPCFARLPHAHPATPARPPTSGPRSSVAPLLPLCGGPEPWRVCEVGRASSLALLPSIPNLSLLASLVSQESFSLPSPSLRLTASLLSSQGNPLRPPRRQAVAPAGFALTPRPDLADSLPFSGLGLRGAAPAHRGVLHTLCAPARSSGCSLVRRHTSCRHCWAFLSPEPGWGWPSLWPCCRWVLAARLPRLGSEPLGRDFILRSQTGTEGVLNTLKCASDCAHMYVSVRVCNCHLWRAG